MNASLYTMTTSLHSIEHDIRALGGDLRVIQIYLDTKNSIDEDIGDLKRSLDSIKSKISEISASIDSIKNDTSGLGTLGLIGDDIGAIRESVSAIEMK